MTFRRSSTRLVAIAAFATFLFFATAPTAFATTGDPTLGLAALEQKLTDSGTGTLTGYMKTVDQGSTIETIPVIVKGLTGDSPSDSLILFEATGTEIASYGGIVAGMSGSPIYVSDGGTDKVIGAVSYGNYFTIGGTGLATPIESMLQLMTDYAPGVMDLRKPVMMDGVLVDKVIISSHPQTLRAAAVAGAFIARPLGEAYIGGLRPGSEAYDRLSSALAKQGLTVIRVGSGLSAGVSSFATTLAPGAGIGVLATRGDMWVGSVGTVTYADGDTILAFGHPAYWTGPSSLYMTNVWITGVWPSLEQPTKVAYPTAIRGTITQDRNAGVMGEVGDPPAEAPVTAEITDTDDHETTSSVVWMSSKMLDGVLLSGAVGSALSEAGYKLHLADAQQIPGSGDTTTTVVVSNGTDRYTIVMTNLFDDSFDIVYASTADAQNAVTTLLSALDYGIETPHIVSVDLQSSVTSERRSATIVGVNTLAPLHAGANAVRVSFLARGRLATQTVDVTVTIPDDSPLTGALVASCLNTDTSDSGGSASAATTSRKTIAQIAAGLEAAPSNDEVIVDFVPGSGVIPLTSNASVVGLGSASDPAIETSAPTPWVLSGGATTQVTQLLSVSAAPITYGDDAWVVGMITGPQADVPVSIFSVPDGGGPGDLLATGTAYVDDDGSFFAIPVSGLTANTELRVAVDAGDGYTPAEAYVSVTVRGRVGLKAVPKTIWRGSLTVITASVAPHSASGTVRFQYYDAKHRTWRALITKKLSHTAAGGRAVYMWWPPRGSWKVRAVYSGDWEFGAGGSPTVTIRVR
jgi:hypothetical protein